MNESEKERILRMLSEGTLRPNEAAQLLAVLSEDPSPSRDQTANEKDKAKAKQSPLMEIQMQRPDGSHYTIQVPPNLFPMFWEMAKVAIRESARTAAQETWQGAKNMVRNKADEVVANLKTRVSGAKTEEPPISPEAEQQAEARRRVLQMVQNGRISAADASRLIEQLDALQKYQKEHAQPPVSGK